jgi:hypothetical protein
VRVCFIRNDVLYFDEQCRLDMTEADMETGRLLLQEEFIKRNPAWTQELELMLSTKKKAEIRACAHCLNFDGLTGRILAMNRGIECFWIPVHHRTVFTKKTARERLDLMLNKW